MLGKVAREGDVDLLREGVKVLAQALMEVEVSAQVGAAHGERVPDRRLTQRNGYRERRWDTRVGTIELPIPKLRDGSYFPSLLEPRRRSERARLAVVQEAYVLGITQQHLAGDKYTKSYVSAIENGLILPSLPALVYLAVRLGVTAGELLTTAEASALLGGGTLESPGPRRRRVTTGSPQLPPSARRL